MNVSDLESSGPFIKNPASKRHRHPIWANTNPVPIGHMGIGKWRTTIAPENPGKRMLRIACQYTESLSRDFEFLKTAS